MPVKASPISTEARTLAISKQITALVQFFEEATGCIVHSFRLSTLDRVSVKYCASERDFRCEHGTPLSKICAKCAGLKSEDGAKSSVALVPSEPPPDAA
jgi:hypothetical protein